MPLADASLALVIMIAMEVPTGFGIDAVFRRPDFSNRLKLLYRPTKHSSEPSDG